MNSKEDTRMHVVGEFQNHSENFLSQPLNLSESLEKFTTVVELLSSNKLSKANAFENRMIDSISDIFRGLQEEKKDTETIWQRYSTGVDSCAKIYGFCIDYLHAETYKVLGGLSRSGNSDPVDPGEEEPDQKQKKSKKKFCEGINTLETDIQAITTTKFDKFEFFDPYFKVVSSKFDASTTSGLLLSNLILSGGMELVLGEDDILSTSIPIDTTSMISLEEFKYLSSSSLLTEELSASLNNFISKPTQNEAKLQGILENMDKNNDLFSESESEAVDFEEVVDENMFNDQGSFDCKPTEDLEDFNISTTTLQEKINSLAERDDYNFFKNPKTSAWGGLDYWKKTQVSGIRMEKQPRKKKEFPKLELFSDLQLKPSEVLAPAKKGYPNFFNETTRTKWEEMNSNIPEDYGFSLNRLTQLFTKPRTHVKFVKNSDLKGNNNSVVVDQGMESGKDEDMVLFAEEVPQTKEVNFVENMRIASTSKSVDIKKLKETMWRSLGLEKNKENCARIGKRNSFLSLIDTLPSNMPSHEVASLSIHSCFITMLHLANEHNLILRPEGACDFTIAQCR